MHTAARVDTTPQRETAVPRLALVVTPPGHAVAPPATGPARSPAPVQPGFRTGRSLLGRRSLWDVGKRAMDVAIAGTALVGLSPALAVVGLLVRRDSPGPVLFRQVRYGRGLERFTVLKFRTMTDGASTAVHQAYIADLARGAAPAAEGLHKLTHDARVTRVGRVLRATSADELPQLLNVLLGQMSIVGPRPALDYELQHYEPGHFRRFDVKPGLTGLWQVSGRSRLGFREMLDLDVEYARRNGPRMDLRILRRTPRALLRGGAA